ncbi:HNH endonuclease [Peribacillus frigoritolerans]|uniref:HNH endonuclease n=1 Tax=Peribacillus frigoritolerans TaxID=450367 RepID=UPI0034E0718F
MLFDIKSPDWGREERAIHNLMQAVLKEVKNRNQFVRVDFDKVSPGHKDFTGGRNDSYIANYLENACNNRKRVKKNFQRAHQKDRKFSSWKKSFRFTSHEGMPFTKSLRKLMEETYDNLLVSRGFKVFGGKVDRKWMIEKYRLANPTALCCPYCGGTWKSNNATLDHFFPKSLYPTLSVSLWNLIPVCRTCNVEYKQQRDPLKGNCDNGAIMSVRLPYHGGLFRFMELSFKEKEDCDIVIVQAKKGTSELIRCQIENFVHVINLNKRWSEELRDLKTRFYLELLSQYNRGEVLKLSEAREFLQKRTIWYDEQIKYDDFIFLKAEYLKWLLKQEDWLEYLWYLDIDNK